MRQLLDIMLAGLDGSQNPEDTKITERYAERGRVFTVIWMGKNPNQFEKIQNFYWKNFCEEIYAKN